MASMTGVVLPQMLERGRGVVINISSILSYMGSTHSSNYSATKAYNLVLSRNLSRTYKSRGKKISYQLPSCNSRLHYESRLADLIKLALMKPNILPTYISFGNLLQNFCCFKLHNVAYNRECDFEFLFTNYTIACEQTTP